MGELERERHARRLSISPSHVRALLAAGGLLLVIGFLIGLQVGRSQASAPPTLRADPASEAELLEVLARVEAHADASGGLGSLTYPEALPSLTTEATELPEGATPDGTALVDAPAGAHGGLTRPPGPGPIVSLASLSVEEAAVVLAGLEESGWSTWAIERRVDGEATVQVGVGPFPDADRAEQALASFRELFADAVVEGTEEPETDPDEAPIEEPLEDEGGEDPPSPEAEIEGGQ